MKYAEENGSYTAPRIDVLHVRTEAGFAATTSLEDLDDWNKWDSI
jgi:hypothetical protein